MRILVEVLREPMLALLLAGGVAYLLLGDLVEALVLLAFASFSVSVTVVQETRTEKVLEALRDLSSPRALVIRDGTPIRIAGREVVRGDLLLLDQGDRVPADAVLIEAHELEADESLLTGEFAPVRKSELPTGTALAARRPGGDDQPFVYSGSLITHGGGIAEVTAVGARSEIGKIGTALAALKPEAPRLQRETTRIVQICGAGGGAVAMLVVLLFGLTRGGWVEAALAGIATGMSMLPEEFPVVLTVFLAMGAWRIGKVGVLTRRAAAIETLGSTTVLCTDKTGTLTENRMAVVQLWHPSHGATELKLGQPLAPHFASLLDIGVLASTVEAVDPMEAAIHQAGRSHGSPRDGDWALARSYGLRPDLLAMSNRWQTKDPERFVVAAKGAPEAIATLCGLAEAAREKMIQATDAMARQGFRVLGIALTETSDPIAPESHRDHTFAFQGLLGLADPIRPGVASAVADCRRAGIRVVMITGDYAATGKAIAGYAGLAEGEVLTGQEVAELSPAELAQRLGSVSVFARIMPEQKLRIVEAYKAKGEVVAMTGDGVNDAPALKAAHIGVAMGKRGTDVAREASSIVLLDDDFGSIVRTIALGRTIYDNIRKAMAFIFAVHVPLAGLALLPLLSGYPLLLGPIHIALLEMIIDPVCALVFEAERSEHDIMNRPPRPPREKLFSLPMIVWSLFQGLAAFSLLAALYLVASRMKLPAQDVRGLVFFALVVAIVTLILVNRSFASSLRDALVGRNLALAAVLTVVGAVSVVVALVPPARELLRFGSLDVADLAILAAIGLTLLLSLELLKPWARCSTMCRARLSRAKPE